ncbi:MAG: DNA topoisomerase IV subunit B [Gammaproteobacteria bacterium]|nr:DNA topoisomerase IV subunit B [Gammaproteobacteria bacterium]
MANDNYGASSIQILEGLEAVRKRPGMYIGSTDSRGLHQLVWEIVDNAVDEALAGFCKNITVTIKQDNSIKVEDDGRGLPVGPHKSGQDVLNVIFTVLHAGGKFSEDGAYKTAGGLHGVGASVVNALSEWVEVKSYKNGNVYHQRFENGGKKFPKEIENLGPTRKHGTEVWFKPDHTIFSTTLYNYQTIKERLKESAYLIKNLTLTLIDERTKTEDVFCYENGISEYAEYLCGSYNKILEKTIYFEQELQKINVEFSIQYLSNGYGENIHSFVNNVRTRDAGSHEVGFKTALTKVFNEFAYKLGVLKEKDSPFEGPDVREGLCAVLSLKVPESILEFEGQTKDKLGTPLAKPVVEQVVTDKLKIYFTENQAVIQDLLQRALQARNAREAARKARDTARLIKSKTKLEQNLSGKLSPASTKDARINELFLVEGDSAGGSAKQGRDRRFQAILPLRGKVLNTEKASVEDVLKNEELNTIIYTIGASFGNNFDIKKCNYNKVIIMTDADVDGSHIQILLLTFFFRYMTELIKAGKVYIALPPLYKITQQGVKNPKVLYVYSDEEKEEVTKDMKKYAIQRYKGLGEMNASQLWETTMDPKNRTLIQVKIEDIADAEQSVSVLMGDDVEPRKQWIDNNVSFAEIDDFKVEGNE